jgi:hypothetical protein
MKKISVLILVMSLFAVAPAISFAEMHDGKILLKDCKQFIKYMDDKKDPSVVMSSIGYCLGYMQGHIDYQQYLEENLKSDIEHCFPVDVSVSQLAKVTVQYLEENPNKLHKPAIEVSLAAFAEAFPCNKSLSQSFR